MSRRDRIWAPPLLLKVDEVARMIAVSERTFGVHAYQSVPKADSYGPEHTMASHGR